MAKPIGRPKGQKNKRTLEFIQLYEQLKLEHGCPVECLFRMVKNRRLDPGHRIQAAKTLLPYAYPKQVAAVEKADEPVQTEFTLTWADEIDALDPSQMLQ